MDSKAIQKHFLHLLERIGEPLYFGARGQGKSQVVYNVPLEVLESYEAIAMESLRKRIPADNDVTVINITKPLTPYDLTPCLVVPRTSIFTYLSPIHQKAADALTKIFMSQPTVKEYFNVSSLCRDVVNPHLWLHSFIYSVLRRPDMKGFLIPHVWEISPDLFFETKYLTEAHKQSAFPPENRGIINVPIVFTGFDTNPEHKVAYFREDVGLNSYHWHYHLVNPYSAPKGTIDRQGEIFYSVHHEMLGRFDTERLSNGLNRVTPIYLNEGSICEEAYFPKLTLRNGGLHWASRQINTPIKDIIRPKDTIMPGPIIVSDVRTWIDRIKEAIDAGFALSDTGRKVDLRNERGINTVGGMLESSNNSVNRQFYGIPHNFGHSLVACSNDPDFRYRETIGVMGTVLTACRDPVFFRWHKYIDLICRRQKETLPPYTSPELLFDGISVSGVEIHTPSLDTNTLLTFWMQSDVDLSRGLDFKRTDVNKLGPIWARLTHLQHREFNYQIMVKNSKPKDVKGTVRIYMAPKLDEQGDPLSFDQQHTLFFQMDKFITLLKPGDNLIQRESTQSTIIIPWEQTFRKLERKTDSLTQAQAVCGCGWPQHLLVPKGKHQGLSVDIFVMISDWEVDRVEDPNALTLSETQKQGCVDSAVLCGSLGKKYPDARAMGFPFDRLADDNISTTADFVKPFANMIAQEVNVFHRDVTVVREGGAPPGTRIIDC